MANTTKVGTFSPHVENNEQDTEKIVEALRDAGFKVDRKEPDKPMKPHRPYYVIRDPGKDAGREA